MFRYYWHNQTPVILTIEIITPKEAEVEIIQEITETILEIRITITTIIQTILEMETKKEVLETLY